MAADLKHGFAIHVRSLKAQYRSILEYPADFWVMAVSGLFNQITTFAFLAVLFGAVDSIAGWSFHEMLILVVYMRMSGAFVAIGWDGIWNLSHMVVDGDLDYRLTRPAPVVSQVASSFVGLQAFGDIAVGIVMLWVGWTGVGLGLDPATLGIALVLFVSAIGIQIGVITSLNCICFWIRGRATPIAFAAVELQNNVGNYPLKIYPGVVKALLTFGLPFAFINYIPAQILTGRLPMVWTLAPPLAALVALAIMALILRAGLRTYESAGH
ncbi:ABC transporter permease [Glycomyces buryatensis]|uniref:ABC transporter permease n=1 Tax=Glycomyces buryatensis TaxID=2570927 RepID=A0A4S8QBU2_9ACTN|nr:ABC-2 family transporter protein [Glycomyces buryatensis]THV38529.1 hypothetical protein FAB82_18980 [Glycomyces buryatensis]